MDKNAVYDAYEKELGIKLKNNWVVNADQYDAKIDLSIASGDIPDFFKVSQLQLKKLVDAGLVMDLTDLYNKYVSDDAKNFFSVTRQVDSARFNGKLMAIPFTDSPTNSSTYIWLRKDWLDKLKLPEPKTMQDVLKIAEAFSKQNPGGADKTYGLAAQKSLYAADFGLTGFFNGYHAYPGTWIKDQSGKLAYGSIQPEMKTALKQLQDMYKAGQIDPEFGVKDSGKENELVSSNKLGMAFGLFWLPSYPLKMAAIKDNKTVQDWASYPLASIDDKPAMTQVTLGVNAYYVISKKAKNPEAVFEILNQYAQPEAKKDPVYIKGIPNSDYYWKLNPMIMYRPDLNVKSGALLPEALKTGDTSKLKDIPDALNLYNDSVAYLNGDGKLWNNWMKSKAGGSLEIMSMYDKQNRYLPNEFYTAPTATMADKQSTLDAKEQEVFTKIITNQSPIDDFDKFVADWKNLGGDAITKEANDWYSTKDKK
ncbi:extracellular solute-binding protein [Paenibacillus filicis]|uniref:Extracellular solute-binding protein n=1 Tax=Paenibacillus gyeongsangnamensis TaxID=3388067 RepID=A0ABT4Q5J8_9BACL|nr:extracellular solute-binding protein [Paenibacillus filicis]MCZ8512148.1 extracellular solute-binding protein [Paenibacillus filicis]